MQSGSAVAPWALSKRHLEAAQHAGETLGCLDTSKNDVLLRCLQAADAKQLVELSQDFFVSHYMAAWPFGLFCVCSFINYWLIGILLEELYQMLAKVFETSPQ